MSARYECIFLDRDGTINIDPGYISKVEDFEFYDYTFNALELLSSLTKYFIIITNQSGVSRGLIEEKELIKINNFIQMKFLENQLNLLGIYYCTDLPENATKFRKPGVGMFLQASIEHNINLSKCIMIGDSYKDIVPANKLGMKSMLIFKDNDDKVDLKNFDGSCEPDFIVKNLFLGAKELAK